MIDHPQELAEDVPGTQAVKTDGDSDLLRVEAVLSLILS